jgi:hypothetical protein
VSLCFEKLTGRGGFLVVFVSDLLLLVELVEVEGVVFNELVGEFLL